MVLDPRTPVLVGVGQVTRRPADVADCPEPADLMAMAAQAAGEDSGVPGVVAAADSVQVVAFLSHGYANPALALAQRIGAAPRETVISTMGGNSPQSLVNRSCLDILAGRSGVVLIAGVEAIHSRHTARRTGAHLPWPAQPDGTPPPDRVVGIDRPGTSEDETARALTKPVEIYPIFETALRLAAGRSVTEHQRVISELWARFSAVAATNPYAWDQAAHTAEEIRTPGPRNRWIGWPYTKLMVAYAGVDQSAALILTSVDAARAAGIAEDRWVFPWSGADSHDHWFVSSRADLASSPAMAANGRAALGLAGIGIDDVARMDLYSCFPSAVEFGADALGLALDDARGFTVTGGLTFFGGPFNNYVGHSIASMAGLLRASPGEVGLVTGNGYYATKHSIGIYASRPPAQPFRHADTQAEVDATPGRGTAFGYAGPVTTEAWSVTYEDGEPALGIVACLTPAGGRTWANTRKPDVLAALLADDAVAGPATLLPDGELDLA